MGKVDVQVSPDALEIWVRNKRKWETVCGRGIYEADGTPPFSSLQGHGKGALYKQVLAWTASRDGTTLEEVQMTLEGTETLCQWWPQETM